MGSLAMGAAVESATGTPFSRRLQAERSLLADVAALNPLRLTDLSAEDSTLRITLRSTPARSLSGIRVTEHRLRLDYPRFFPALPLELYLETPIFHPNVHPETGFVCLWDRHRVAHTAEDALHKTVAILGWRLLSVQPEHTMQPDAAELSPGECEELRRQLEAAPLLGVRGCELRSAPAAATRRRLS